MGEAFESQKQKILIFADYNYSLAQGNAWCKTGFYGFIRVITEHQSN